MTETPDAKRIRGILQILYSRLPFSMVIARISSTGNPRISASFSAIR